MCEQLLCCNAVHHFIVQTLFIFLLLQAERAIQDKLARDTVSEVDLSDFRQKVGFAPLPALVRDLARHIPITWLPSLLKGRKDKSSHVACLQCEHSNSQQKVPVVCTCLCLPACEWGGENIICIKD